MPKCVYVCLKALAFCSSKVLFFVIWLSLSIIISVYYNVPEMVAAAALQMENYPYICIYIRTRRRGDSAGRAW